ncbi:MAG: MoaD/ThiS family protein [Clostridia bacterium]
MEIKVKFFATLRKGRGKVDFYKTDKKVTVKEILDYYEIEEEEASILYVNGRDAKLDQVLEEGDVISIFPPVGGG